MTDKEKLDAIRAEIERRIAKRRSEIEKYCGSLIDKEKLQEDLELLSFIDSLEEPVKCMYTNEHYTDEDRKVLCEDCEERCEYSKKEELVSEQNLSNVQRIGKNWKEELVSEDLEEELDKYIHDNFTIEKDQLDKFGIEEKDYMYSMDKGDMLAMVRHFANWQKAKDSTCASEDLNEEIKRQYEKWFCEGNDVIKITLYGFVRISRHFALWGAHHLK